MSRVPRNPTPSLDLLLPTCEHASMLYAICSTTVYTYSRVCYTCIVSLSLLYRRPHKQTLLSRWPLRQPETHLRRHRQTAHLMHRSRCHCTLCTMHIVHIEHLAVHRFSLPVHVHVSSLCPLHDVYVCLKSMCALCMLEIRSVEQTFLSSPLASV